MKNIIEKLKLNEMQVTEIVKQWYLRGYYPDTLQDANGSDLEEICDDIILENEESYSNIRNIYKYYYDMQFDLDILDKSPKLKKTLEDEKALDNLEKCDKDIIFKFEVFAENMFSFKSEEDYLIDVEFGNENNIEYNNSCGFVFDYMSLQDILDLIELKGYFKLRIAI